MDISRSENNILDDFLPDFLFRFKIFYLIVHLKNPIGVRCLYKNISAL